MPSGPKKRRASRRKQAEAELVPSTAGATERCIGSMETNVAAEVSNDAVQLSQQVEEHVSNTFLESEVMELPNGNIGGDLPKENDGSAVPEVAAENEIGSMESDVAAEVSNVAVPEVVSSEVAVESDGIVVGASQLASKKDNNDIESLLGEEKDSPSLNGVCMSVEQADNSKVSQKVEEHAYNKHQEPVVMELLNGKDGNMQKGNGCFNGGFSVPEVMPGVEDAVENDIGSDAIKLASKKDEKDSEFVGDDSALPGNFPKLLDLVKQIEHLVQEAKGLIAQQKEQM